MIPFIRSIPELMSITESRDKQKNILENEDLHSSTVDSVQSKRYIRSLAKKGIELPDLPKIIRHKWIHNKKSVSRFLDDLDYNNQIQSSYDLTLLERQNKSNQKDVA